MVVRVAINISLIMGNDLHVNEYLAAFERSSLNQDFNTLSCSKFANDPGFLEIRQTICSALGYSPYQLELRWQGDGGPGDRTRLRRIMSSLHSPDC